jgi:hypothetical protein
MLPESIGSHSHSRGARCQPSGRMVREAGGGAHVRGRTSLVMDTDGRRQVQTERGRLIALDQDGSVVLDVNGKHLLLPKARGDTLGEVE